MTINDPKNIFTLSLIEKFRSMLKIAYDLLKFVPNNQALPGYLKDIPKFLEAKEKMTESKHTSNLDFFAISILGKFDYTVREISGKIKEKLVCITMSNNETIWMCCKDKILVKEKKNGVTLITLNKQSASSVASKKNYVFCGSSGKKKKFIIFVLFLFLFILIYINLLDGSITCWRDHKSESSFTVATQLKIHKRKITNIFACNEVDFLFSADNSGKIVLWQPLQDSYEVVHQTEIGEPVRLMEFDKENNYLYIIRYILFIYFLYYFLFYFYLLSNIFYFYFCLKLVIQKSIFGTYNKNILSLLSN